MPKTGVEQAIYCRHWRKVSYNEKRFNKALREYVEMRYKSIFNEYTRFYKALDEAHPEAKDITKTKTFKQWKKNQQSASARNEEIPEPAPRNEETPEPAPRNEEIPEPAPRNQEIPEPAPRNEKIPESAPRNEEIPEPAPRNEEIPESAPRNEEIPEPAPRNEEIPEPALRNEEIPESAPRNEEIPEPAPRNEEIPESAPRNEEIPESAPRNEEIPEQNERDILAEALGEPLPQDNLNIDQLDNIVQSMIEDLQRDDDVRALLNDEELFPPLHREEDEGIDMDVEIEIDDLYDVRLEEALW